MPSPKERGRPAHPDVLTPAEWRVVEAVRHGLSNPAIARRQGVSMDAVKFHVANVLQKLGFARRTELRRWDGVRRDSNLFLQETPMNIDTNLGAIGQIARSVNDIEAATAWYRDVLGLQHLFSAGAMAFFDCAGVRLMLTQGDGAADSIIYFRVADIRGAHATLLARGVTFINSPHMIHRHQDGSEEWMAFFQDNQQRPLGLMASVSKEDVLF
jgi:DNA-binding CsgD family transcriptional regulator/catechol 2,3-dioxygenase-like lactoylglutathione lyase family enzyme